MSPTVNYFLFKFRLSSTLALSSLSAQALCCKSLQNYANRALQNTNPFIFVGFESSGVGEKRDQPNGHLKAIGFRKRRGATGEGTRKSLERLFSLKAQAPPPLERPPNTRRAAKMQLNWEQLFSILLAGCLIVEAFGYEALAVAAMCVWIWARYGDFLHRSYITLDRDLSGLKLLLDVKSDLFRQSKRNRPLHEIFLDICRKHPQKSAIIEVNTERQVTFEELNLLANRYANYFQRLGYKKGDPIALFMENSIDFVAAWLGLSKIGVVTAWINSSLKSEQLAHCIQTSKTNAVICSKSLAKVLATAKSEGHLDPTIELNFYICDLGDKSPLDPKFAAPEYTHLTPLLEEQSIEEPAKVDGVDFQSVLCFIYTSGTTGMPKAAVMRGLRFYSMAVGAAKAFKVSPEDRIYISMPLYHTAAGILGMGQTILRGSTAVIRPKFSASNFWKDCIKHQCTASQYIGEICRYLLAQPPSPEEKLHKVKLMYGNGLRQEIWQDVVDRFGVRIGELYGSTEGTSNLVNIDGQVGSCGFLPISPITSRLHPVRLIKVDEATGEVIRGDDGLCIPCRPGETGAMVSTIRRGNPLLNFEGYLNQKETSKKVLSDVFRKGDQVFVSGDILHWDRLGYVYFRDRTGDTFRWKGENVSTTEVEKAFYGSLELRKCISDVTVYGVRAPRTEGRTGMAAIVKNQDSGISDEEMVEKIADHLKDRLVGPAIPTFLRLCSDVQKTGTFKLIKTHLQSLGLDANDNDRLFVLHQGAYVPFDAEKRRQLDDGTLGL
ncbi:unnamed protein product [Bursaphelenchus xylophilus]|uniref:Very long-chain fatty acid transport protein n=2 Tax=Bursaphelenchus xylophilus TaxID=6326 RepID=A0A811L8J4_BURXY|nr:unnamed protein product [Bursaphelenchus xylophilus]CAG9113323.1 unnamed protein product [Bursaphelenchus xylophilus]